MNVDGESGSKVYSEILVMASTLLLEQSKELFLVLPRGHEGYFENGLKASIK